MKRFILSLIGRAGYVVQKTADYTQAQRDTARLLVDPARLLAAERKLAQADREFRLGRDRDSRELEEARAESWQLRERLVTALGDREQARSESSQLRERLVAALDEIRRLKIRVEEVPQLDYQVLMREQNERAAFQDADPAFMELYEQVKGFSMTSIERLYSVYKAIEYICRAGVSGSIVECGVWRGGSMMMAALTLQTVGDTSRQLYLFDTYEGLPKPNEKEDVDLWGHSAYNEWTRHRLTDESSDWAAASLDEVQANLISTGYPRDKLIFVKGMVQNTLPDTAMDAIALLRLDTDWYESTVCELDHLYPRITEGGILIVDDYGHYRGQRKAVDEYFERQKQTPLLNRIDYSGRLAVKLGSRSAV